FWDIPIGMQEQEFKSMIKNKSENVTSCNMSTRGLWLSAIVQFKKEYIAKNLLMKWPQIIEEESCRKDIKEIKEQVKNIDERLELVETHCVYEILNDEEVKEMDISDNKNEKMNEKEKSKAQTTNNKKEENEMEKTINYIYETVKTLLEENKTTLT
ncbi:553_t:CDS:2, partial [Diversispora eburnea]